MPAEMLEKLFPDHRRKVLVSYYIYEDQAEAIKEVSKAAHLKISDVMRKFVDVMLRQVEGEIAHLQTMDVSSAPYHVVSPKRHIQRERRTIKRRKMPKSPIP